MSPPRHRDPGAQARPRARSPAPSACRMVPDTGTAAERAPGERPRTGGDRPWTQRPSPRQRRPDTGSGACRGRGQRAGVARSLRACKGRVSRAGLSGPGERILLLRGPVRGDACHDAGTPQGGLGGAGVHAPPPEYTCCRMQTLTTRCPVTHPNEGHFPV